MQSPPTNYIIQCQLGEGISLQMRGLALHAHKWWETQREYIGMYTFSGNLVPPIVWWIHPALALLVCKMEFPIQLAIYNVIIFHFSHLSMIEFIFQSLSSLFLQLFSDFSEHS